TRQDLCRSNSAWKQAALLAGQFGDLQTARPCGQQNDTCPIGPALKTGIDRCSGSSRAQRGGQQTMFLPLQIIFAVLAWRRGWRWRTLIPLACGYAITFGVGVAFLLFMKSNPESREDFIDIGRIIGLMVGGIMTGIMGIMATQAYKAPSARGA